MTKKANSPRLNGVLRKRLPDGTEYLTFRYKVIRLYELPPDVFLNAGLSVVPLTLLGDLTGINKRQTVERMRSRFAAESESATQEQELIAATYVLTGARYSREFATQLLKGALRNVFDVQDSDTFQQIKEIGLAMGMEEGLRTGKAEGIAQGKAEGVAQSKAEGLEVGKAEGLQVGRAEGERQKSRDTILRIGAKRFGAPSSQTVERITGTTDIAELDALIDRLLETESWDEFWKP